MSVTNVKTRWVDGNLVFYDKSDEIICTFDGTNRKVSFPSGSSIELPDEVLAAADIALADGAVLIGNSDGAAEAQALTGDVTVTNAGVTAIGAGKVLSSMLAAGAGVAALLTAGLGGSASYLKTKNDTTELVAAHGTKDRAVLVVAIVDEIFADGDGGQPTFTVGEADTLNKFFATGAFTDAAAGTVLVSAGINTSTKNVSVTGVAATGTGTGGITVVVIAIPTT